MYVFLDESGDLGFDFNKRRTSRFFVITLLATQDFNTVASAIKRTLRAKLRQKKKTRHVGELKGSATTLSIKNYFHQQMIRGTDWYLHSIILDKSMLLDRAIRQNTHHLYNVLAQNILRGIAVPTAEQVVHLHVDRSKEQNEIKIFDHFVRSSLEARLPVGCTLNIDHLRSQDSPGLQAVDLFCYGIARKYEQHDIVWYSIFQERIKQEVLFRV